MALLGAWKLEEATGATRLDSTANGLDLPDTGGVDSSQVAVSKFDTYSAEFPAGTDNRSLSIADASLPATFFGKNGGSGTDFTIYYLIQFKGPGTVNYHIVGGKENMFEFRYGTAETLICRHWDGGSVAHNSTSGALVENTWYSCVARWRGSTDDQVAFWLNGVQTGALHTTATMDSNANEFTVGAERDYGLRQFPGIIDEVAVWDEALSDTEIGLLHTHGISYFLDESSYANGLIALWYMEEAAGSNRLDSSIESNDLSEDNGNIPQETTTFHQGAASVGTFSTSILTRADADLSSTFPTKLTVGTGSFTLGAWIYGTDDGTHCIFTKGISGNEMIKAWVQATTTLYMYVDGTTHNDANYTINAWHHFVIRYDHTTQLFDSALDDSWSGTSNVGVLGTSSEDLHIGSWRNPGTIYPWLGYIDEFFVYDRALSNAEATAIYSSGLDVLLATGNEEEVDSQTLLTAKKRRMTIYSSWSGTPTDAEENFFVSADDGTTWHQVTTIDGVSPNAAVTADGNYAHAAAVVAPHSRIQQKTNASGGEPVVDVATVSTVPHDEDDYANDKDWPLLGHDMETLSPNEGTTLGD